VKTISPAKLRAIADRLERDTAAQVAELRRLADLAEGVSRVLAKATPKKAKKKAAKVVKAKKAARKTAKKVVRKTAKKVKSASRGR